MLIKYAGQKITLFKLRSKTMKYAEDNHGYTPIGSGNDSTRFYKIFTGKFRNSHNIKTKDIGGNQKLLTIPADIETLLKNDTSEDTPMGTKKRKLEVVDQRPAKKQKVVNLRSSEQSKSVEEPEELSKSVEEPEESEEKQSKSVEESEESEEEQSQS